MVSGRRERERERERGRGRGREREREREREGEREREREREIHKRTSISFAKEHGIETGHPLSGDGLRGGLQEDERASGQLNTELLFPLWVVVAHR